MKAALNSRTHRKQLKLKPLYAALLMLGISQPILANDWNIANGNWSDDANWVGGEPENLDGATIDNGGAAEVTEAEVADLVIVGDSNNGTLTIINGGSLDNRDRGATIGNLAGSTGTATVDGAGSRWTGLWTVGNAGTGTLNITNGGSVSNGIGASSGIIGNLAGSTGTVTVNGEGSNWTTKGDLRVGLSGTGTLNITDGGSVSSTRAIVGMHTGGIGTVTVSGAGSNWTSSSSLRVGYNGTGTLNITNGGSVSTGLGVIGNFAGGTGTVNVDGAGSSWTDSNGLSVGVSTASGALNITNGGSVNSDFARIGSSGGGTVAVNGADSNWTISGNLSIGILDASLGTLHITTGGIVNVAGALTIAGRTGSSGILNIGTGGEAGILNTASVDGGNGTATLNFNHTDADYFFTNDGTNSGTAINIEGGMAVNQIGSGTTVLNGTNTYTGTTTINGGGLTLQGGSAISDSSKVTVGNRGILNIEDAETIGLLTGAGTVNLNDDLTVDNNESDAFSSYRGVIQGSSTLIKQGSGALVLGGDNTYSGGTIVSDGILAGITSSLQGEIENNAEVIFIGISVNGAYTSNIFGTGSVGITGAGSVEFTGVNTYTGATTITDGTLFVSGSIANSTTTINAGGTLGGGGTVGDVFINGGIIAPVNSTAPGDSIGTLNTGSVDFTGGGQYNVEVDAEIDLINATGTANLSSGIVNVIATVRDYATSTDYTILTASGGLGGTEFASVNANLAFLDPTLTYDANNVFLNLARNNISLNDDSIARTKNQKAVSTTLANSSAELQEITNNILPLSGNGARAAYDSLSGVQHTHSQLVTRQVGSQFKQVFTNRGKQAFTAMANNGSLDGVQLAYAGGDLASMAAKPSYQNGWWLEAFGNVGDVDNTTNASGADYHSAGVAFGADTQWQGGIIGIAGSYARSDVDARQTDLDIDSYQAAVYGLWQPASYYINASLGFGYHKTDTSRRINVGALNSKAKADYHSSNVSTSIEVGRPIAIGKSSNATTLTPFAGLDYTHLRREGFTEKGADTANLKVKSETEDSLRSTLGLRLSHLYTSSNGMNITPYGSAAYVYEHLDTTSRLDASFIVAPASSFKIDGTRLSHSRAQFTLGVNGQLNESTTLNIGYTGEFAGSDDNHSLAATLRIGW